MIGRLVAAAAIVVAAIGIGVVAHRWLFPVEKPPAAAPAPAPAPVPVPAPVARPAPATPAAQITVKAVRGRVERRRGGAAVALDAGDKLDLDDVVRTADGTATLELGDAARVEIDPGSTVSVLQLAQDASRIRLADGRISAEVARDDRHLRVEVADSDAVAEAARSRFAVLTDGNGHAAVASRDGAVLLSARGRTVTIGGGQQSVVAPGLPPSAPARVPPTLFLKVSGPRAAAQREKSTTVAGSTVPGAVVSVNGVRAVAGADGNFAATVPLRDGENALLVRAQDALGRRSQHALPSVTVDATAPTVESKVTW